jgi:purine-binding chemotaxis protein CheW
VTAMDELTNLADYVTFTAAGQLFGLPIGRVQDVFKPMNITRVPLAGPEIAGVLNLRGRVVTAIHLSNRLGLQSAAQRAAPMAIGIESGAESFGLLVARVSAGVFRLDGQLLVVLDVDRILHLNVEAAA